MRVVYFLLIFGLFTSCKDTSQIAESDKKDKDKKAISESTTTDKSRETPSLRLSEQELPKIPKGLKWETNKDEKEWSSPDAKKGGVLKTYFTSFPLTIRYVGPDSNSSFRSAILNNHFSLTDYHPNTKNVIPRLATHWAYGEDQKTVYYKLDKDAKWSDGNPVTADDYLFTLEFMRSKFIVAPWYNNYYTKHVINIIKYDDYTIAVVGATPKSKRQLHYYYGMSPTPRHFYKLTKNFVKDYNWKIAPNTGPYKISKIRKGKYITFKLKKNWWGRNKVYNKNRYNVDKVKFTKIIDENLALEYFNKGKIDFFNLTIPELWYEKTSGEIFTHGYAHKVWFYVDKPQPNFGMWLNQEKDIFKDIRVRKAFGHAMNIDKVIKTVLRNDYQRAQTSDSGYGEYTNKNIKAREFNLKKADELLDSAGWEKRDSQGIRIKGNKRLEANITYGRSNDKNRLVIIREEAKKAGIMLQLQKLDPSAAFKQMQEKNHEIAYMGWGAMEFPQYWGQYHSVNANKPQTNNISNTANKELDIQIEKYRKEYDENARIKISHKIQQLIYDDASYIPTWLVPYFREAYWSWWQFPQIQATKSSSSLFDPFAIAGGCFWFNKNKNLNVTKAKKKDRELTQKTVVNKMYKL